MAIQGITLGKALEYTQKFLPKMKLILGNGSLEIEKMWLKELLSLLLSTVKTDFFQYAKRCNI